MCPTPRGTGHCMQVGPRPNLAFQINVMFGDDLECQKKDVEMTAHTTRRYWKDAVRTSKQSAERLKFASAQIS